jgi:transcriptional regulator with XRE-family HTH domain
MDLRSIVEAERQAQGLSWSALAAAAECSHPHLCRWAAGQRSLSLARIHRVLDVLGLELVVQRRAP